MPDGTTGGADRRQRHFGRVRRAALAVHGRRGPLALPRRRRHRPRARGQLRLRAPRRRLVDAARRRPRLYATPLCFGARFLDSQIRIRLPSSISPRICCSPIAFAPRSIRNTDGGYSVTVRGEGFQRLGGSSQLGVAACEFRGSDDTGGDEVVTTRVTAIVSDRKLLCDGATPPAASFHGPNSFTSRSANSSRLWALKLLHQAQIMRPESAAAHALLRVPHAAGTAPNLTATRVASWIAAANASINNASDPSYAVGEDATFEPMPSPFGDRHCCAAGAGSGRVGGSHLPNATDCWRAAAACAPATPYAAMELDLPPGRLARSSTHFATVLTRSRRTSEQSRLLGGLHRRPVVPLRLVCQRRRHQPLDVHVLRELRRGPGAGLGAGGGAARGRRARPGRRAPRADSGRRLRPPAL